MSVVRATNDVISVLVPSMRVDGCLFSDFSSTYHVGGPLKLRVLLNHIESQCAIGATTTDLVMLSRVEGYLGQVLHGHLLSAILLQIVPLDDPGLMANLPFKNDYAIQTPIDQASQVPQIVTESQLRDPARRKLERGLISLLTLSMLVKFAAGCFLFLNMGSLNLRDLDFHPVTFWPYLCGVRCCEHLDRDQIVSVHESYRHHL